MKKTTVGSEAAAYVWLVKVGDGAWALDEVGDWVSGLSEVRWSVWLLLGYWGFYFLDKVLGVFGSKMLENYWCCKKNGGVPFFKVNFSKVLTYCFK